MLFHDLSDDEVSEFTTRRNYIDKSLTRSGWKQNKDWIDEYELYGMPNASGVGYADYVLFNDNGLPLAVIEAKRTMKDPAVGRQQAKLYADLLEKKFHKRPVIFLTNGYETFIWDDKNYNERRVSEVYSKRDLQKYFNLIENRQARLSDAIINDAISGRYYQKNAIKAVCSALENKERKALLVMATGSGKTRTVISIVDVLMRKGWIKNVLFLADRTSLVTQAKRSFTNLLPDVPNTNMCETENDPNARIVFSTYQTMINLVDKTLDKDGTRVFSNAHFDLIIVDEAHRSIYNKYQAIFNYFDSYMVGLTATPKDEVDKNTYDVFLLPKGQPTYAYELKQAVTDGYLVSYKAVETKVKFLEEGITYGELSLEEQEIYESTFVTEDGEIPERIEPSKLNDWIFNRDTIVKVLDTVMRNGLRIEHGSKIGKTIIFAKNHRHAEAIYKIFNEQYPYLNDGFCRVIDNTVNYAQSLIDEFSDPKKTPQIAISVDMLDTGIDIPEILNLAFFKKVYSRSKFWQMIGRGTRLCPGLIDGKDKEGFLIFDFCSNFEFFRLKPDGIEQKDYYTIQGKIFMAQAQMAYQLQDIRFQEEELQAFRKQMVEELKRKIDELNKDDFTVKQHLRAVEHYSKADVLDSLSWEDIGVMGEELANLIHPYDDNIDAIRFDALIRLIQSNKLQEKNTKFLINHVRKSVQNVAKMSTIPDVASKLPTIRLVLTDGYLEEASIMDLEVIRIELRNIMQFMDRTGKVYVDTLFTDQILSQELTPPLLNDDGLANYYDNVEHYIRTNMDNPAIRKIHENEPLTTEDISELERILWEELGTKEDYERFVGTKPIGQLVRQINGLSMEAAKQAFSKYLDESRMDNRQIYFVNQLVEYLVQNGMVEDNRVLMESPFTDRGSIVELFPDLSVWNDIRGIINDINNNANV